MEIKVFSGFSKKPNSTKQPTTARATLSVTLKAPTSVLNPVFVVTGFDLSDNYVQWGIRYYFIDDIVIVHNNVAEYHCSTDVLATFKTAIGTSSQYILRSASSYNGAIVDSMYPTMQLRDMQSVNPDSGTGDLFVFPNAGTFVFGIQGQTNGDSFGSTTYYCFDVYHAADLMDEIFNISNAEYDANDVETLSGIPEEVYKSMINPQQYITSCMFLPFTYESIGSTSTGHIKLGWYDFTSEALIFDTSFDALPSIAATFTLPKHPQASRGSYMNGDPYTDYELQFQPFGVIPIPADMVVGVTSIYCKVICDVITGNATLNVYAGTSDAGQLLTSRSAKVGVDVAISGGTYDISLGGRLTNLAAGAMAGSGILGKLGKVFDDDGYIASTQRSPEINTSGNNGALDYLEYPVKLYARFTRVVDDDNTQHGRPLCAVRTINTLSGYIQCLKPDLDISGTKTEKNEIIDYLRSGFYYE